MPCIYTYIIAWYFEKPIMSCIKWSAPDMVRVISWGFPAAVLEPAAEAWACTWARACVRLELLMVSVISWPLLLSATGPELLMTWLKSWVPAGSTGNTDQLLSHYSENYLIKYSPANIPAVSCSERLAIVTWAGAMVEGCRARLVSGWMTTLADTEGSVVDMSWPPEWETRPVSTPRGWERRPPCCNVCWRSAWSIWERESAALVEVESCCWEGLTEMYKKTTTQGKMV